MSRPLLVELGSRRAFLGGFLLFVVLLYLGVAPSASAQKSSEYGPNEGRTFDHEQMRSYSGRKVPTYRIAMPLSFGVGNLDADERHINWDNFFVCLRGAAESSHRYSPAVMIAAELQYEPLRDVLEAATKRLRSVFQEVTFSPVRWATIDSQDWLSFEAAGLAGGVETHCRTYLYSGPLGKYEIVTYTYPGEVGNDELSMREAEQAPQRFGFTVDVEKFTQRSILALLATQGSKIPYESVEEVALEMRAKGYQKVDWQRFFTGTPTAAHFVVQTLKVWLKPRSATF